MNPANAQDQTAAAVIQKELEKRMEIELLWRVAHKKNEVVKLHDDGPSAFKPVASKEKPAAQADLLDMFELVGCNEKPAPCPSTFEEPVRQEAELSPSWSYSISSPSSEDNGIKKRI
ncbi:hypothetical protein CRE_06298 [Caenorhabditis remanei]|uniref:Uncharacterized protein n=1 Tax=Caenorhabditis remanei TaxID=31234 RepID=E3M130_CAERE|nr:hypothetical protein CRE_06298 [Caenorhabditis remanei]